MKIMPDLKYSKDHEWVKVEGNQVTMGITDFAQAQLGDVVFVEVPELEGEVTAGQGFSVVESVKAVSDIYAPLSGKVIKVNDELTDTPELINEDPYGQGWIAVIELTDPAQLSTLLSASEYEALTAEGGHL